jgi:hypothetical protein
VTIDKARAWLLQFGVLSRRHDRGSAHRLGGGAKLRRVAGHVGQGPCRCLGQAFQQLQRGREFVCLTGDKDKVDKAASGIADPDDLAAQTAPGTAESLLVRVAAIESQTQRIGLLGRAPAAFWCARAMVPSIQANASFGSPSATTWAMILSHTPLTAQRRKRR